MASTPPSFLWLNGPVSWASAPKRISEKMPPSGWLGAAWPPVLGMGLGWAWNSRTRFPYP